MKEKILAALSHIIDPDLKKDIVTLNFVKDIKLDGGHVSFSIELTTPACPVKETFKSLAQEYVLAIDGVESVDVQMTAQPRKNPLMGQDKKNLSQVSTIIAVSSCKGGVGKSTVAMNLAYTLMAKGATVGIFDADVYGPSLPTMLKTDQQLLIEDNDIVPIEFDGMRCVSFGHALEQSNEGPAILRGPMVSQIISQFLCQTKWGELDYLIIDMPPGTGDVQITLCQLLPITAAVIVTTPQHLSFIDVVKGIEMFDTLQVPVVGAVENMSYLQVNNTKHYPFGKGAMDRLVHEFGFSNTVQLELDEKVSQSGDGGTPFTKQYPESKNSQTLMDFVDELVKEISVIKHGAKSLPKIGFSKEEGVLMTLDEQAYTLPAKELRLQCRSALSRDEFSGELLIKPEDISDSIYPVSMNPVGNYALGINWSDGHSSLYPYRQLLEVMSPVKSS